MSIILAALAFGCQPNTAPPPSQNVVAKKTSHVKFLSHDDLTANSPEVLLGQRLFRETRFSQFFSAHSHGDVNSTPSELDETTHFIKAPRVVIENPYYRLGGINCASCHLVNEARLQAGAGMRSYSDFQARSELPKRGDQQVTTLRNSPSMVNITKFAGRQVFFHHDGEFADLNDLVIRTWTGRNFGWLPGEEKSAIHQIAEVIRHDDGKGALAEDYGGAYGQLLRGEAASEHFRLPTEDRIDASRASDTEILKMAAKLVVSFIDSLQLSVDESGLYDGSPYDLFLQKNALPRAPKPPETDGQYAARLLKEITSRNHFDFVSPLDKQFQYQNQDFAFGPTELEGLKVFLRTSPAPSGAAVGNCVQCHSPPHFTDFSFHNTGAAQEEYDAIHGTGAFMSLPIPKIAIRNGNRAFLPPSPKHPESQALFKQIPSAGNKDLVDLGLWNFFANPDFESDVQANGYKLLKRSICESLKKTNCTAEEMLDASVARFKTPTLRDLGQSAPYLHTGRMALIEEAVRLYQKTSNGKQDKFRNLDREINKINLDANSIQSLSAFLKALNEDYH